MPKILIIEDERDMALGLKDNFEIEGYEVEIASDGEMGLSRATDGDPDIIILDVMLPKLSGFDVCRGIRKTGSEVPIIMLTARGQEMDKVVGLEIGADDYVTKPFGLRELLARIRVQLRNSSPSEKRIRSYSFGGIELDFATYRATKNGEAIDLSTREFELLEYFIRHRGDVVTREALLDEIWGIDNYPFTRTVDNHISKLRQKIEADSSEPRFIVTVHR
ncbi:MAG: response regulator transcription factor, partial [Acidobacteriota bacterium]|nr:response regulator transcription factor [Acidobacteriota bacterium]